MFGKDAGDDSGQSSAEKSAAKRARKSAKAADSAAAKASEAQAKAAAKAARQDRKTAKAESKNRRAEAKARQAAAEAAAEAAEKATTGPARLADRLTDPKTAKRTLVVAKVVIPVLAPFAIKAVVSTRGFIDEQRAHRLGVPAAEVAAFRGPTGTTGARISGLSRSIDQLADRKGGDRQIARFVEVSRAKLTDLTTAVQASASMPRSGRKKVLRAVNQDLNQISADLMTHLVGAAAA